MHPCYHPVSCTLGGIGPCSLATVLPPAAPALPPVPLAVGWSQMESHTLLGRSRKDPPGCLEVDAAAALGLELVMLGRSRLGQVPPAGHQLFSLFLAASSFLTDPFPAPAPPEMVWLGCSHLPLPQGWLEEGSGRLEGAVLTPPSRSLGWALVAFPAPGLVASCGQPFGLPLSKGGGSWCLCWAAQLS